MLILNKIFFNFQPRKKISEKNFSIFSTTSLVASTFIFFGGIFSVAHASSMASSDVIEINYQHSQDHGLDFSDSTRGPIRITSFTDNRSEPANEISDLTFSDAIATTIEKGISDAFTQHNATLSQAQESLTVSGSLIDAAINDESVSLKLELKLTKSGKTLWNNTLFSKQKFSSDTDASNSKKISTALNKAIDKIIAELFFDDYFIMEVLD